MSAYDEPVVDDFERVPDEVGAAGTVAEERTPEAEDVQVSDGVTEDSDDAGTAADAEAESGEGTASCETDAGNASAAGEGSDGEEPEASYEEVPLDGIEVPAELLLSDDEALAYKLLKRAAGFRGVAIDREAYLRSELAGIYDSETMQAAIASSPLKAGISSEKVDGLADAAIVLEAGKVAGLSALAGIPGGLAALGTIPADILQYFAHALRVEQKLAYLYGWESLDLQEGSVDDHALYQLILFLGVLMDVEGTGPVLARMAPDAAELGFAEALRMQGESDQAWRMPIKKVLSAVGTNVTKGTFAEAAVRGIPVLAGLVSGSVTLVTFRFGAIALKKLLRELPQATDVERDGAELVELAERLEAEAKTAYGDALRDVFETAGEKVGAFAAQAGDAAGDLGERAGEAASVFAEQAGAAASALADKAAEYATIARDRAGEAAKAAAIGFIRGLGTKKKEQRRSKRQAEAAQQQQAGASAAPTSDLAQELRILKGLVDEGIITQEEFDAKKRQLLGL